MVLTGPSFGAQPGQHGFHGWVWCGRPRRPGGTGGGIVPQGAALDHHIDRIEHALHRVTTGRRSPKWRLALTRFQPDSFRCPVNRSDRASPGVSARSTAFTGAAPWIMRSAPFVLIRHPYREHQESQAAPDDMSGLLSDPGFGACHGAADVGVVADDDQGSEDQDQRNHLGHAKHPGPDRTTGGGHQCGQR